MCNNISISNGEISKKIECDTTDFTLCVVLETEFQAEFSPGDGVELIKTIQDRVSELAELGEIIDGKKEPKMEKVSRSFLFCNTIQNLNHNATYSLQCWCFYAIVS